MNNNMDNNNKKSSLVVFFGTLLGLILLATLWAVVVISITGLFWLVLTVFLGINIAFRTLLGISVIAGMVGAVFRLMQG